MVLVSNGISNIAFVPEDDGNCQLCSKFGVVPAQSYYHDPTRSRKELIPVCSLYWTDLIVKGDQAFKCEECKKSQVMTELIYPIEGDQVE